MGTCSRSAEAHCGDNVRRPASIDAANAATEQSRSRYLSSLRRVAANFSPFMMCSICRPLEHTAEAPFDLVFFTSKTHQACRSRKHAVTIIPTNERLCGYSACTFIARRCLYEAMSCFGQTHKENRYALPHWLAVRCPVDRPRDPLPDFSLILALYDGRRRIEVDRAAATLVRWIEHPKFVGNTPSVSRRTNSCNPTMVRTPEHPAA